MALFVEQQQEAMEDPLMKTWNFLDHDQSPDWMIKAGLIIQIGWHLLLAAAYFIVALFCIVLLFCIMAALIKVDSAAFMIICVGIAVSVVIERFGCKIRT